MNKFKKINFKILLILLFIGLFLFNIIEVKAMMSAGDIPNPDESAKGVQIVIVSPPDIFNLQGSETSNFAQVCASGEALNIVLDVTGKNKIEFQDPLVDMCDNDVIQNLDDYVQIDKAGEVSVRSDLLPALKNRSANITMRNLPFEKEPDIEVDGKLATDRDIENKSWDTSSKTLTFKAKHFTTYKAVEASNEKVESHKEIEIISEKLEIPKEVEKESDTVKVILLIFIAVLFIVGIVFLSYKLTKSKSLNNK